MNCAIYLFPRIGGLIGKPLDFYFDEIPEKNLICKYIDEEFHKSYFNYSNNLSIVGALFGVVTDFGLAFMYHIKNPNTFSAILSILYFSGIFILGEIKEIEYYHQFPKKIESNTIGWQSNDKSKCSNLENFYVTEVHLQTPERLDCDSFDERAEELFIEELSHTISLPSNKLPQLKKKILPLNFVEKRNTTKGKKSLKRYFCSFKFYIEFAGGKTALQNSLK